MPIQRMAKSARNDDAKDTCKLAVIPIKKQTQKTSSLFEAEILAIATSVTNIARPNREINLKCLKNAKRKNTQRTKSKNKKT